MITNMESIQQPVYRVLGVLFEKYGVECPYGLKRDLINLIYDHREAALNEALGEVPQGGHGDE